MPDPVTKNFQENYPGKDASDFSTKLLDQGLYSKELTFKVRPNDDVRISYSGHYGSGDLSLTAGLVSRNAFGIANISQANLGDGSVQFKILIDKSFKGNLQVGLNGQSTIFDAKTDEGAAASISPNRPTLSKAETSKAASINELVLPNIPTAIVPRAAPEKTVSSAKSVEPVSSTVIHEPIIFKNTEGLPQKSIKPLSREQAPEFYDLVKSAERLGLELGISNKRASDGSSETRTVSIQSTNHALRFSKAIEIDTAGDYASRVAEMTGFMKSAISEFAEQRQETIERIRHVPGLSGLSLNHAESPAIAALLAEARNGGIDVVAVKESDKGVTLRIWAPDLKRYSPNEVTISREVLRGAEPDIVNKQALDNLEKEVSLYQKRAAWMMDRKDGVSDKFVEHVLEAYEAVPRPIMNSVILSGVRLQLQDKMSSKADLDDAPPRGREDLVGRLPTEKIWDSVGGAVFWQGSGVIVLNEKTLDTQNLTRGMVPRTPEMIRATALHELGHVLDDVLAKRDEAAIGRPKVSKEAEFEMAYTRDTNHLSFRAPAFATSTSGAVAESPGSTVTSSSAIQYYLLPGDAGRSELFATLFAAVVGKEKNIYSDIKDSFPNSYENVERHIDSLR